MSIKSIISLSFHLVIQIILVFSFVLNAHAENDSSEQKKIIAAVLNDFPPLYTVDRAEQPAGFAIDLLDNVSQTIGLKVDYLVVENWAAAMETIRNGQADIIPGIGISPARSSEFQFSVTIETIPVSCFVRKKNYTLRELNDLRGHNVAVINQSAANTKLKAMSGFVLIGFDNIDTALLSLLAGNVDAFVFPEPVLWNKARLVGLDDKIKVVGDPLMELKRGYLMRKNDSDLLDIINPAIKKYVLSPKYLESYVKWYGKPKPFWTVRSLSIAMILIIIFLFCGVIIWRFMTIARLNVQLEKSVKKRTSGLSETNRLLSLEIEERKKIEQKLKQQNVEMARVNKAFVGRELRMIELKNENKKFQDKLKYSREKLCKP